MTLSIIYNISGKINLSNEAIDNFKIVDKEYIEMVFVIQEGTEETFNKILDLKFEKAKKSIFVVSTNQGMAYGFNMGIRHANFEYIMFANSDIFFLDDFEKIITEIGKNKFNLAFFGALKDGDQSTIKESFRHQVVTIWNTLIARKTVIENNLFFQNYSKLFFDFIYRLIKYSPEIVIKKNVLVISKEKNANDYNIYDILLDATKIFHQIELLNDLTDKEYYRALATIMVVHEFIFEIKNSSNNSDALKYAIKNANIVITNIYPEYKKNKFLIEWKSEKIPKFILNFEPNIKYCLREL